MSYLFYIDFFTARSINPFHRHSDRRPHLFRLGSDFYVKNKTWNAKISNINSINYYSRWGSLNTYFYYYVYNYLICYNKKSRECYSFGICVVCFTHNANKFYIKWQINFITHLNIVILIFATIVISPICQNFIFIIYLSLKKEDVIFFI